MFEHTLDDADARLPLVLVVVMSLLFPRYNMCVFERCCNANDGSRQPVAQHRQQPPIHALMIFEASSRASAEEPHEPRTMIV